MLISVLIFWGPEAQEIQKILMQNNKVPYPKVGKVTPKQKKAIQENFLMNDVSMALWTKARSLDELGLDIYAMEAYVECINMTHGRIWDSEVMSLKRWFWSPAEDCANRGTKIFKIICYKYRHISNSSLNYAPNFYN